MYVAYTKLGGDLIYTIIVYVAYTKLGGDLIYTIIVYVAYTKFAGGPYLYYYSVCSIYKICGGTLFILLTK